MSNSVPKNQVPRSTETKILDRFHYFYYFSLSFLLISGWFDISFFVDYVFIASVVLVVTIVLCEYIPLPFVFVSFFFSFLSFPSTIYFEYVVPAPLSFSLPYL